MVEIIEGKTIAMKKDSMKGNIWEDIDNNKYDANGVIDATNKRGRRSVVVGQFVREENGQVIFQEIFGYNAGMRRF